MTKYIKNFLTGSAYLSLVATSSFRNIFIGDGGFKLRVLLYHGVSEENLPMFEKQMFFLKRSWKFLTTDEFNECISGKRHLEADSLLLTFDDGFYSNRVVSERVLAPLKIPALFFVVSKFIDYKIGDDWRNFVANNINPSMIPQEVPDYMRNLNWNDLSYLLDEGHAIGAHTATHKRLSNLHGDELHEEIINSADYLESRLGQHINHFAFTFGNLESFSSEALKIARMRFKYIHTGLRGDNANLLNPWSIKRDSLEPTMPLYSMGGVLEGALDFLYRKKIEQYNSWGIAR